MEMDGGAVSIISCVLQKAYRTSTGRLRTQPDSLYFRLVPITRRSILTALSAAAAGQAQRNRPPNWKPRLGILASYSDANLEFARAEGFTSMQLRLDPNRLDDAAIAAIKDKIQR